MKVYISGPITGYEDGNRLAFEKAKKELIKRGYEVISPFDQEDQEATLDYGPRYWELLSKDILLLSKAEGIIFLPNWENSKGARLEAYISLLNCLPMWEYFIDRDDYLESLNHSYVAGVCAAQWADKEMLKRIGLAA